MTLTISPDRASNASDSIFTAAFEGDIFKSALAVLSASFPEAVPLIMGLDSECINRSSILCPLDLPQVRQAFAKELDLREGWVDRLWGVAPCSVYDTGDVSSRLRGPLDRAFAGHRPALNELAGVVAHRSGPRQIVVELRFAARYGQDRKRAMSEFLDRFGRDLDVATRIRGLRQRVQAGGLLNEDLLSFLPFAAVLCDADRRVMLTNSRADAAIGSGDKLTVTPDRVLHLPDPEDDERLAAAIARLMGSPRQRIALIPLSMTVCAKREVIFVARLRPGRNIAPFSMAAERPSFAVFHDDLAASLDMDQDMLWRVFGLSAKESALALDLLAGRAIGELAQMRGVSKETLRNQLAGLMRKTGTSRQQDLVALLTRLAMMNALV